MLDYFTTFMEFKKKNKIKLPHIKRYVNQITKFNDIPLESIPNSKGSKFIERLLSRFDINKLTKIKNDYERLDYITKRIVPKFKSYIISNQEKYILRNNSFVNLAKSSSTITCPQIVLFSWGSNYFKYLPLGMNEFFAWENVHPVNMLHHNATEFTTDLTSGIISFSYLIPDYVILEIDIVMLLMQYSKYLISVEDGYIMGYIKNYCITPLADDMKNIWLMNFIIETIDLTTSSTSTYYDSYVYQQIKSQYIDLNFTKYNFLKTELKPAVNDIIKIIMDCTIGKIEPERVLYSIPVVGFDSIMDYIQYTNDKYYIERNNSNTWILFLKDICFIKLLLLVFGLNPNYSKTKELIVYFRPIILRYQNNNFWARIKDPLLKDFVKMTFELLTMQIDQIKML